VPTAQSGSTLFPTESSGHRHASRDDVIREIRSFAATLSRWPPAGTSRARGRADQARSGHTKRQCRNDHHLREVGRGPRSASTVTTGVRVAIGRDFRPWL